MSDYNGDLHENAPEWEFKEVDEDKVQRLSKDTGLSPIITRVLVQRGIDNREKLKRYIKPGLTSLYNPYFFRDMHKAVLRVRRAVENGEKILVFGDRDVDGVLSTAMLYRILRIVDASVEWDVPEGEFGYGIEKERIKIASEENVKLILLVDSGISSYDEVEYANSLGMDTIILDHHIQPGRIPRAYAIINPKLDGENYPFRYLSAGGVVLKFIHAFVFSYTKNFNRVFVPIFSENGTVKATKIVNGVILEEKTIEESIHYPLKKEWTYIRRENDKLPDYMDEWLRDNASHQIVILHPKPVSNVREFSESFLRIFWKNQKRCLHYLEYFVDLAAISTIADIMPLQDENRIIVREGLKKIPRTENVGLKTLAGYCDIPSEGLRAKDVAWGIAPFINSAGRMGEAKIAVELFITEDLHRANEIARILVDLNEKRKEKGEKNLSIIAPMIDGYHSEEPIIVLSTDRAEHGVSGIIASRISKKFLKPTIIIINDDKIGIGSGRGRNNFDLVGLFSHCSDLLLKYGGHKSAVGFTIETENIEEFRERIKEVLKKNPELLGEKEVLEIEAVIQPEMINSTLASEVKIFEPTGVGNPQPQFALLGIEVIDPVRIGKEGEHVKFHVAAGSGLVQVVGWGLSEKAFRIFEKNRRCDLVVSIDENYYMGSWSLQLLLHDLRASKN